MNYRNLLISILALGMLVDMGVSKPAYAQFTCDGSYSLSPIGDCEPGNIGDGPPVSVALAATPSSIQAGSYSRLSWNSANAANCSLNQGIGSVSVNGYIDVAPGSTTSYTITCGGSDGSVASDSKTVTVTPPPPPVSVSLTANPANIVSGNSSTLSWSSANATSCTGSAFSTGGATSGSVSVSPSTTTNYSVSCTGAGGTGGAYTTIYVSAPTVADLTAGSVSPTSATAGVATQYTATVSNIGNGTSGSFPSIFQFDNGTVLAATYWSPAISPGGSTPIYVTTTLSAGTYTFRACANYDTSYNQIATESNYGNNCGPYATITVSAAPQADLTAYAGPNVSGTAGQPVSFSATAANIGNASANSFPTVFNIANVTALDGGALSLAAGQTTTRTGSYTFSSPGTYYVKLCVDMNTSWQGVIAESNENNNCSAEWTVTIAAAGAPPATPTGPTYSCSSDGTQATLSWNATANTTFYYVRADNVGGCKAGWQNSGGVCVPNPDQVYGTSISLPVNPGQGYNWWVHSANSYGYSNPVYGYLTCNAAAQADLTAGAISPTTATAGTPVEFSAYASNIGSGASGSFPSIFQLGSGTVMAAKYWSPALSPGGSTPIYVDYTPPSSGSFTMRACANYNTSWTAITTESNYGNNCGAWTTITVPAPTPPTCTLTSSGPIVPTNLNWSSTNATSCTGAGFSTGGATSGSVSTNTAGNYSLSCTGAGGSCSTSTTLSNGTCSGTASVSIDANPKRVRAGQTSAITWSATNVPGDSPSCTISGPGVSQTIAAGTAPTCAIPNGSAAPTISTQSTYTINCGGATSSVTVNVVPKIQEF